MKGVRSLTAGPPPMYGDFLGSFAALNGLAAGEVTAIVVRPGMEFGACLAWWRPGSERPTPHVGLDFLSYRDQQGIEHLLSGGARIPALYPGRVAAVFQDFLGDTVLLLHPFQDQRGWRFCTIYGHLVPAPGLGRGTRLTAGDQVGAVAGATGARVPVAPHLHLSLGWLAAAALGVALDWPTLERSAMVELLDPVPFLGQGQMVAAAAEGGG